MPKTIGEDKRKIVGKFLDDTLAPKIKKLVAEVNVYLKKKHNVQVGAELSWLMQELTDEEVSNVSKN